MIRISPRSFIAIGASEEAPFIRFYAGCPLTIRDGVSVGTLSILDTQPKVLSDDQIAIHLGNTDDQSTAILNFNHSSEDFTLAAIITGKGEVNHSGSGTSTLTGLSDYSGATHVANSTLRAGTENTLAPILIIRLMEAQTWT